MKAENNNKEQILSNIKIVTEGIIKDIGVNNSFSAWKNTERGLRFIIEDTTNFYKGVKLWINIVEDQIIHCNDLKLLKSIAIKFKWIDNFLEIKSSQNNKMK
tara:strand:- start:166 stop:471 length:306 start_codon:yes stop_codon:yes gene_type:complete